MINFFDWCQLFNTLPRDHELWIQGLQAHPQWIHSSWYHSEHRHITTPLIECCRRSLEPYVEYLLQQGADPNHSGEGASHFHKTTPLICAVKHGDHPTVQTLLKYHALPHHKDSNDNTALIHAVMKGHEHLVQTLLNSTQSTPFHQTLHQPLINAKNDQKQTALSLAIKLHHPSIALLLIQHKADLSIQYPYQQNIFMLALSHHHQDVFQELIHRATLSQLQQQDNHQNTVTDYAITTRPFHLEGLQLLKLKGVDILNENNETSSLMNAASAGHVQAVDYLLESGAQVNYQPSSHGDTALLWAIESHQLPIIQKLLNAGANPSLVNNHHESAWGLSLQKDQLDVFQLLIHSTSSFIPPFDRSAIQELARHYQAQQCLAYLHSMNDYDHLQKSYPPRQQPLSVLTPSSRL